MDIGNPHAARVPNHSRVMTEPTIHAVPQMPSFPSFVSPVSAPVSSPVSASVSAAPHVDIQESPVHDAAASYTTLRSAYSANVATASAAAAAAAAEAEAAAAAHTEKAAEAAAEAEEAAAAEAEKAAEAVAAAVAAAEAEKAAPTEAATEAAVEPKAEAAAEAETEAAAVAAASADFIPRESVQKVLAAIERGVALDTVRGNLDRYLQTGTMKGEYLQEQEIEEAAFWYAISHDSACIINGIMSNPRKRRPFIERFVKEVHNHSFSFDNATFSRIRRHLMLAKNWDDCAGNPYALAPDDERGRVAYADRTSRYIKAFLYNGRVKGIEKGVADDIMWLLGLDWRLADARPSVFLMYAFKLMQSQKPSVAKYLTEPVNEFASKHRLLCESRPLDVWVALMQRMTDDSPPYVVPVRSGLATIDPCAGIRGMVVYRFLRCTESQFADIHSRLDLSAKSMPDAGRVIQKSRRRAPRG